MTRDVKARSALALMGVAVLALAATGLIWSTAVQSARQGDSTEAATASRPGTGALREPAGFTVWERNRDGEPIRWDPCSPIELVWRPDGAPVGARADLEAARHRAAEATGLDLTLRGRSDEPVTDPRLPYQPERYGDRWAPVSVAWTTSAEAGSRLLDTDRGVAMPIAVGPAGDRTYVSGQILLNAERDDLRAGFDDRAHSWGATLLHELLHVLGLGHVDDPDELMYEFPGEGPVELGPGDRAGADAIGASNGCRDVPAAGPVEVVEPPADQVRGHGVP
ncbi:MAG: hypothetical protein WD638_10270 [Nitriliruptoraceae bacterium]